MKGLARMIKGFRHPIKGSWQTVIRSRHPIFPARQMVIRLRHPIKGFWQNCSFLHFANHPAAWRCSFLATERHAAKGKPDSTLRSFASCSRAKASCRLRAIREIKLDGCAFDFIIRPLLP
jgi:hypothetical protein